MTPGGLGKLRQAVSSDGGLSWSSYSAFDFNGQAPFLYQLSNGAIISAFRIREGSQEKGTAVDITAFIYSLDEGKTWSEVKMIYGSKGECGYPSVVELPNNRMMIIYYTNEGKAIEGKIFRIKNVYHPIVGNF
jgi:hypothetical protein